MSQAIFNNPKVVARGWYFVCPSVDLLAGHVQSFDLCGQRIAVFRGEDGQVRALDAYCPHMGTDLGIGDVVGNHVRCFFHYWAFDGAGQCQDIPCQAQIPTGARLPSYATAEQYGCIWIYPDEVAPVGVAEFDELKGHDDVIVRRDRPLTRHCHHHICMMNGIDVQHLQTVHRLPVDLELSLQRRAEEGLIDFTLTGDLPQNSWQARLGRWLLGPTYTYTMRYAYGCLGLLTLMKGVRLIPPLHMLYAYRPLPSGETWVQPIYVTRCRPGLWGWVVSQLLLLLTQLSYYALRNADGQIYDNIHFDPKTLLPIDQPLVEYMRYINQLEPSRWSRHDVDAMDVDAMDVDAMDVTNIANSISPCSTNTPAS
ncbi:aromatic ring-hydroxylating dioxygenase subunit alpha [filamentous cyanobacterium LEGE 07170]|nr:aromatic ring-hydroxylating dioxygenase subunit alpha [filamentous cyanobacterium LEGE 07170]